MIKLFNAAFLFARIVWRRIDENEADSRMDWQTAWSVSKGIWFGFPEQPCSKKPYNGILNEEQPPF
jgi:hypothetical protein